MLSWCPSVAPNPPTSSRAGGRPALTVVPISTQKPAQAHELGFQIRKGEASTKRMLAAKELLSPDGDGPTVRVLATGTPMKNPTKGDCWVVLNFVQPGQFGEFKDFQEQYMKPIDVSRTAHCTEQELAVGTVAQEEVDKMLARALFGPPPVILPFVCVGGSSPACAAASWLRFAPLRSAELRHPPPPLPITPLSPARLFPQRCSSGAARRTPRSRRSSRRSLTAGGRCPRRRTTSSSAR